NWTVQVGAYADREKAEAQLARLAADRPGPLSRAARLVTPIQWDETHTIYRARFAGLSLEAASALCASLNGAGQACFLSESDKTARSVLHEAALQAESGGAVLKDAPARLIASTATLQDELVAVPELSAITEKLSSKAPKLVALNDKLAANDA